MTDEDRKDAWAQKLEAQLEEAEAEVERLEARCKRADAEARLSLQRDLESLSAHRDTVRRQLAEVREASDDAWQDIKSGVESASRDLAAAMRNATSQFSD